MQIGMGEPVQEEVEKIRSFWEKFSSLAKTKKFILVVLIVLLVAASIITIAVISQIPPKPVPPELAPTPTPITPTEAPLSLLPPLSSEAATLTKELQKLLYDDPNLSFPALDWQITLQK